MLKHCPQQVASPIRTAVVLSPTKCNGSITRGRLNTSRDSHASSSSPNVANLTRTSFHTPDHRRGLTPNGGRPLSPPFKNGGLNVSCISEAPPRSASRCVVRSSNEQRSSTYPVREFGLGLGLMCVISLFLSVLALIFIFRITPLAEDDLFARRHKNLDPEDLLVLHETAVGLGALTLSLDLFCLLVCTTQFLLSLKLLKSKQGQRRSSKYLRNSARSRLCAIVGLFLSIPVFLTGLILHTFLLFHSRSAIISAVLLGLGIIFCACAISHNVYLWQKESSRTDSSGLQKGAAGFLDTSTSSSPAHELSTLV